MNNILIASVLKSVSVIIFLIGLVSCSNPHEVLFSTDPSTWDDNNEMLEAIKSLDDSERQCVNVKLDRIRSEWDEYKALKAVRDRDLSSGKIPNLAISEPKKPTIEYKKIGELISTSKLSCIKLN